MPRIEEYPKEIFIKHYYKILKVEKNWKSWRFPVLFLFSFGERCCLYQFTESDSDDGIYQSSSDGRTDDCCWMDTAILLTIGNDTDGDQLKGRNIKLNTILGVEILIFSYLLYKGGDYYENNKILLLLIKGGLDVKTYYKFINTCIIYI